MSPETAEVPPDTPPSPMAALLAAFLGVLGLLYAWLGTPAGTGGSPGAAAGIVIALLAFPAAALLYARYRKRRDAFDRHIAAHGDGT